MNLGNPAVLGIDPGPTTGLALLDISDPTALSVELLQCTPDLVRHVVASLSSGQLEAVAIERFVVGHRAARSANAKAGQITRELVAMVIGMADELGCRVMTRTASDVKPWATDKRLAAAGLVLPPGARHAVDGARHALYSAVRDCGIPDPLSTRHRSPR